MLYIHICYIYIYICAFTNLQYTRPYCSKINKQTRQLTVWKSKILMASFSTPSPKSTALSLGYSACLMSDKVATSSAALNTAAISMHSWSDSPIGTPSSFKNANYGK